MTTLIVCNQTLDYTRHTDGDLPLIFIHGIASSQHTWLDFPLRFAKYGSVITLSLPGHYPACFPEGMQQGTLTDSWLGDVVGEAIQQITGGVPALLVGHSAGGYTALAAAWRAPQLVKGVISLGGFARGVATGTLGMAQRLHVLGAPGTWLFNALIMGNTRSSALVDLGWQRCFYNKAVFRACAAYHAARTQIYHDLRRMDARSLRFWFYQMHTVSNLVPHLPRITAPVLAIAGKHDSTVPAEQAMVIGERVPHGTTVLLDGLDHAQYMEQPEKVEQSMMEWLDIVLSSSP
jgi:pimeloyl-ACP methyl ester carboxylesterase